MRRSIFVLLLVAAAIVLVPWRRLVWMGLPKPTTGMFANGKFQLSEHPPYVPGGERLAHESDHR